MKFKSFTSGMGREIVFSPAREGGGAVFRSCGAGFSLQRGL